VQSIDLEFGIGDAEEGLDLLVEFIADAKIFAALFQVAALFGFLKFVEHGLIGFEGDAYVQGCAIWQWSLDGALSASAGSPSLKAVKPLLGGPAVCDGLAGSCVVGPEQATTIRISKSRPARCAGERRRVWVSVYG